MATGKPGFGAPTLLKLIAAAGDELLLLIVTGRLDRDAQGAAWVRAVQERGAWLAVWPPASAQFPDWLERRLRAAGLEVSAEAVTLLAEATEGNLLAAQQEIDKLRLRFGAGVRLGAPRIERRFADSARFQVLQLTEATNAGRSGARAADPGRPARRRATSRCACCGGWCAHCAPQPEGPRRLPIARLVARAARVDRVAKGQAHGDAWDELALLVVEMCGRRTLPLPRFAGVWERARA